MPVVVLSHPLADGTAQAHLARFVELRLPQNDSPEAFLQALADADAVIIRAPARLDAAALERTTRLRAVANIGAGIDHIDTAAVAASGAELIVGAGANATAVAEWVIWSLLSLSRRFDRAAAFSVGTEGTWSGRIAGLRGNEATGTVLGIVGFGHIGRTVARMARHGLGMRIAAHDPMLTGPQEDVDDWYDDLAPLLEASDALTVHVPLVPATRNLIGEAELARLGPDSILVNASRGGVVDEDAVIAAVRESRLRGAALDVFATEPPSTQRLRELAGVPGLITTPHVAGISVQAGSAFAWAAVVGVLRVLGIESAQ